MQIKMNNVCKKVKGADLLSDISLTMESGNIYGFVGDNGAGKTVLFKILLGLMKKTSGSITINGAELNDLLQDVGFVIERPEYIPYYNAFKNLAVIAAYHKKADHARIREVLTMFGLEPEDKKTVGKYSLGMKQKLALAMVFLEDPAILILDEPLSALDESSVSHAREKILEAKAQGKLIVVASHYKEDIQSLCDVVYKMKAGRIVAECREEPMNAVNI